MIVNSIRDYEWSKQEQEKLNILKYQAQILDKTEKRIDNVLSSLDLSISQAKKFRGKIRKRSKKNLNKVVVQHKSQNLSEKMPTIRSWDEILLEVERNIDSPALITDFLSSEEIHSVEQRIFGLRKEFDAIHELDELDWAICGVAGTLAALVDIFLVQMPKNPGFLGGESSKGGPLSNWIRERVNGTFSPGEIRRLEHENWVPYDPAHSANLSQKVEGLGPRTHRFQSLGHDPVLGFLFGVRDILFGEFTAIDKNGNLISQNISVADPSIPGMSIFGAIGRVFGHLKSDIATSGGLPVPLMPLFQFLQFGEIGKQGHTIGEVTRLMYQNGYDFRHFLSMSLSPLLIEVIVRFCYFAKRMHEGYELKDAIPVDFLQSKRQPKLQTMLFFAHLMATAANTGKVAITQNPLAINFPQWIACFKYTIQHLGWILWGKSNARFQCVQENIDAGWQEIDRNLEDTWNLVIMEPIFLI